MKPGLNPAEYSLPASDGKTPVCLVVDDASYTYRALYDSPKLQVPVLGQDLARSLAEDLVKAKLCSVPGEKQPAIFFLEGEWTPETVLKLHKKIVDKHLEMQNAWYLELVKLGDIDWAKKPGSHQMVTGDSKLAAKALGYERPWLLEIPVQIEAPAMKNCKGCANLIPAAAIVCGVCRVVQDEKAYAGLKVAANV